MTITQRPTVKKIRHLVPSLSSRGAQDQIIEKNEWRLMLADPSSDRPTPRRRLRNFP
jgi:hypothetical protein